MLSADTPPYEIIRVSKDCRDRAVLYKQCIQVRIEVFVHEQKFALEDEVDEADSVATHFLLRWISSEVPVATLRIYQPSADANYYKLGRLAVLKQYRKYGLGAALMKAAHEYAWDSFKRSKAPREIVLHSQLYAKGFYAKLGYVPEGDTFDEDGAPHQKMRVYLDG